MASNPTTSTVTKKYGNILYYWNEDDKMLWKQVLPTRGMYPVAEIDDPLKIDEEIMKDFNGEW